MTGAWPPGTCDTHGTVMHMDTLDVGGFPPGLDTVSVWEQKVSARAWADANPIQHATASAQTRSARSKIGGRCCLDGATISSLRATLEVGKPNRRPGVGNP